jgi:hypothetical protein
MKIRITFTLAILVLAFTFQGNAEAAGKKFYKGNMHTHSWWSDGNTFPEEVAKWYKEHGYNFLAVTDHNLLQEGKKTKVIGKDTIVLKTLAEYRGQFEVPGEFILICSEEVTDAAEKRPVHLNAINVSKVIKPQGGPTVLECIKADYKAMRSSMEGSETPDWITLNHPNFGWGQTASDLAQCGVRFFEVYNGHPSVRNYGDSAHPSTETMWDQANKWRIDHDQRILLGTATDDTHQYDQFGLGKANPGKGWVMVCSEGLDPVSLYQAMQAGDFYSTTGVELSDFKTSGKGISVKIQPEEGVTYTVEFIGWLKGKDQPEVLQTVSGTRVKYNFSGQELFVRARVKSSKLKVNPFAEGDVEMAWLQPVEPGKR